MAFSNTVVARYAAGIWGLKLGNSTMESVLAQLNAGASVASVINPVFNDSFGSTSNAAIADMVVANVGLTGQAATDGKNAIIAALTGHTTDRGAVLAGILDTFAGLSSDPTYGTFAQSFNTRVNLAAQYGQTVGTVDAPLVNPATGTSFNLSVMQDSLTGTAANDTFNAYVFNNSNTLQSGDFIDGGAGVDTLYADMGSSANFAVTPITRNVENIVIRAQSSATDTGDNNVGNEVRVDIDAERISGATRFESNNSRADLIIEDVRILSSQITKDITIAFVNSDPGNVDFGVYFDLPSLRSSSTSSSTLTLQAIDLTAYFDTPSQPLLNLPYDGISFSVNGQLVVLQDATIQNATTFAELLAAIQGRLSLNPLTAGIVTAAFGPTFSVVDSQGRTASNIPSIVLSGNGVTFGIGNWLASQGVPAQTNTFTNQFAGTSSSTDLVTSTIVLDNVGRGAYGGDLVVGGLANGETTGGKGVERFEITVEGTSRVSNIDSTMVSSTVNALKEVTIKNGTASGSLFVRGNQGTQVTNDGTGTPGAGNNPLPGAVPQHDGFGFNDVRLIDASAMRGAVSFNAAVTPNAFNKYILLSDTQNDPAGDNGSSPGQTTLQVADFQYYGGGGADNISVTVDGGVAGSNSDVQVGREDFTFLVSSGAGNDTVSFTMVPAALIATTGTGGTPTPITFNPADNAWYQHQHLLKNVTIDTGTGNDTVRTPGAGDIDISLGDGNDTVYTDNTGGQVFPIAASTPSSYLPTTNGNGVMATWVFNTNDQTTAGGAVVERTLANMTATSNDEFLNYRARITVTYKGVTSTVQLPGGGFNGYAVSDLMINQKIKEAIVNSPVLSKVLAAVDGPGYSLIVKSLIDGVQAVGDLDISITSVSLGDLSTTEKQALWAADGQTGTFTDVGVQLILDTARTDFLATDSYDSAFGNNGAIEAVGANSVTPSDNFITPGTGNDVIILGTTESATPGEIFSSNEIVAYPAVGFGDDTIFHFDLAGEGIDQIDFSGLGGVSNASFSNAAGVAGKAVAPQGNRSILIDDLVTGTDPATTNSTAAAVARYYADSANTAVIRHVVVIVDTSTNVANVWQVVDAIGDGGATPNITATLAGSIDLADTLWSTLTAANFA